MNRPSETIFSNGRVLIPMADVQHIEKRQNGSMVVMKSTRYNCEIDEWDNPVYLPEEEAKDFIKAYCYYRSEIDYPQEAPPMPDFKVGDTPMPDFTKKYPFEPPTPEPVYISIIVAPYAIADFIRALYRNGDHDIAVTKEDNSLTVRIPLNENHPPKDTASMSCSPVGQVDRGEKEKGK